MININGDLISPNSKIFKFNNRGYLYGDTVFETLKVVTGNILFWEDHYFRLMASMRIMRIDIPNHFTMEFLENQIHKTLEANGLKNEVARVRLNVDRGEGGLYLPLKNTTVNFSINTKLLSEKEYSITDTDNYVVDLYKDFYLAPGLLSGLKTNNKNIQVLGSIYAKENDYQNCLVLNTNKTIVEALNGNIFIVKNQQISTPPLTDGCLRGIFRKQLISLLKNNPNYEFEERSISPFELQKADELFITNVIKGIIPITKYRKKTFNNKVAKSLVAEINKKI